MKSALSGEVTAENAKHIAEIDKCIAEIDAIRKEMKKSDAEIRRLELSSRRKLDHIRANLNVENGSSKQLLRSENSNGSSNGRTKYSVMLVESEEGFAVWCDELPGCCSQGATRQEALKNIKDAIREYLAARAELPARFGTRICREVVTV